MGSKKKVTHIAQKEAQKNAHTRVARGGQEELTEEQRQMLTRRKMASSAWAVIIGVIAIIVCLALGIH